MPSGNERALNARRMVLTFTNGALVPFMTRAQLLTLAVATAGEEAEHFVDLLIDLKAKIDAMPRTYDQDGLGDMAIAHLHYFIGNTDVWVTELDKSAPGEGGQHHQGFGFVCLNGDVECAELGYISIPELLRVGMELDLHWTPKTIREIKKELAER
jgi:hypothetical protein